ncbi:DUF7219 family protein [Myxacorys almedinensis]|uniref:Isopropylmalate/homocitrate/citramalate synthases n=1 Tax=Myxacorys almedinensis A TaxID=2690445 RepID=A0A8J7Z6E3_9CYAN|nr:hypothetical protein [Myxacorys almedinensis]NDJ17278.1 hypothetical protein [Myxacorys almedinensis A]
MGNADRSKNEFLYPTARYRGDFTPEHLAFNANLQEFAQRVSLLCGLETSGKIPPQEAYDEIRELWKQLKESKKNLLNQLSDSEE